MTLRSDLGPDDPRSRHDGLGLLTTALFPDPRVRLHVGAARSQPALPPDHVQLTSYAVVPSASRPRFLVPLLSRRTASKSLRHYNALRRRKVRAARVGLSMLARLGAFNLPAASRLTVTAPAEIAQADMDLIHHLSIELGLSDLAGACGVRTPDPNYKPTVQLFDNSGCPVGFAKVGWNDATRSLVAAEARALQQVPHASPDHPIVPRVLLTTEWRGQTVVVVEPLPSRIRRIGRSEAVRVTEALVIARRGGPPKPPQALAASPFIKRTLQAARSPMVHDAIGDVLAVLTERFARLSGDTAVEFGWWHGDWVPWNLGTVDGRLVAWDWEHSGPDMPVGSDIAHDALQRAIVLDGLDVSAAVERVRSQLVRTSPQLGLSTIQRDVVLVAYLIEMWLRTHRLAAGGGGWNPSLHPGLLHEVERRLA
jgi:hypothetical protein